MYKTVSAVGLMAGLTILSACDGSWVREAGVTVNGNGNFGQATLNNSLIQQDEQNYALNLATRFASEVPTTINFAFNSSQLDQQARVILTEQANWIRQFPEVRFRVYGHTDAVGGNSYNKRLGQRRANAAVSFLTSQGIKRSRLEAVSSFGESQLVILSQGPERQNRRTVTEVTGFVKRHPTVLDGKYAEVIYRDYIASAVPPTLLTDSSLAQDLAE
jgi:outer membrane protein OmpA-like peptidoglycan-associated protein